jgi:hypothetical protein
LLLDQLIKSGPWLSLIPSTTSLDLLDRLTNFLARPTSRHLTDMRDGQP